MTATVVLLGYAAALGLLAPLAMRAGRWTLRDPGLAMWVWLAEMVSWVASVGLAGLVTIARRWHEGSVPALAAGVLALGVAAWAGVAVVVELLRSAGRRRRQVAGLALVGRPSGELGAIVVDHDVPAAYCLPNRDRSRRIVITTAALSALDDRQLRAVLAHERAHLRRGHHLAIAIAEGLGRALPAVPLLHDGRRQMAALAEMAADDEASRQHGRQAIAAALVRLARAQVVAPALGTGSLEIVSRVERLLAPPAPLGVTGRWAGSVAAISALVFPAFVVTCASAVVVLALHLVSLLRA